MFPTAAGCADAEKRQNGSPLATIPTGSPAEFTAAAFPVLSGDASVPRLTRDPLCVNFEKYLFNLRGRVDAALTKCDGAKGGAVARELLTAMATQLGHPLESLAVALRGVGEVAGPLHGRHAATLLAAAGL